MLVPLSEHARRASSPVTARLLAGPGRARPEPVRTYRQWYQVGLRERKNSRIFCGVRFPLVTLLFLLACAPHRKIAGELSVRPLRSLLPRSRIIVEDAVFRLEDSRIVAGGAAAGTELDLVAMDDGCLRGSQGLDQVHICQDPPDSADKKGVVRWHNSGGALVHYSTQLLEMGDKLRVESGLAVAEFNLPEGTAGDEARRHPEMLGAAWALGAFPASADDDRGVKIYTVQPR